ncbi:MAG: T9SS type A sorting domain-containing protein [Saprospiraceae bacterium]|nr:T9SS type A sorting domain-containing protein [Saprospiraceae bacterium]
MNKFLSFLAILLFSTLLQLNAQNTRNPVQGSADRSQSVFDPTQVSPLPDVTPPDLDCTHLLNANLTATGSAFITANDLILSVQDNKTPVNQIKLGVRIAGTGVGFPFDSLGLPISFLKFDCLHQGNFMIEVWAADLSGNTSVCTTSVKIDDSFLNCPGENTLVVCSLQGDCGVEEIQMMVSGTDSAGLPYTYFSINDQGCQKFDIQPGSNIEIMPAKDDNPLNGVTTYDIVLIGKQIMGFDTFSSPYQWVAADINGDLVINSQDTMDLRKLITGIYFELPNNTSWRFIPKDYVFPWPNPLSQPYPQSISYADFSGPDTARFVAVKIGDVNGTAVCNNASPEFAADREVHSFAVGSILVFPNPTTSGVQVKYTATQKSTGHFELFDHCGKMIYNRQLNIESGINNWDIPTEVIDVTGLYVWRLQIQGQYQTGKILRQ